MDAPKIEKGIPFPFAKRNAVLMVTCAKMEVGDSFRHNVNARPNLSFISMRTGFKFSIRADGNGWRIWRIS